MNKTVNVINYVIVNTESDLALFCGLKYKRTNVIILDENKHKLQSLFSIVDDTRPEFTFVFYTNVTDLPTIKYLKELCKTTMSVMIDVSLSQKLNY